MRLTPKRRKPRSSGDWLAFMQKNIHSFISESAIGIDQLELDLNSLSKRQDLSQKNEDDLAIPFTKFNFARVLQENIAAKGYQYATPIQEKCIPLILDNRDVVGIADTGTGKTAAFLLPLLQKVYKNKKDQKVLILVPTRELAIQNRKVLSSFGTGMRVFSTLLIGGQNIEKQLAHLRRLQDFIIGTPGRVKDLLSKGYLGLLGKFNNLVLDEVDRMLDMGFIEDVRFILGQMAKNRQNLFFSATLNKQVQSLLAEFSVNPTYVSVKTSLNNIQQKLVPFQREEEKFDLLKNLLGKICPTCQTDVWSAPTSKIPKFLIFGNTKKTVEDLFRNLRVDGFKVNYIHGGKTQSKRIQALESFRDGQVNILIATDVAARGLDIPNVTFVINYDLPQNQETYVHRIGRTGRIGEFGYALTFVKS